MIVNNKKKNKNNNRPQSDQLDNSQLSRYQSMYTKCIAQGNDLFSKDETLESEKYFQSAEHYLRMMNLIRSRSVQNNKNQKQHCNSQKHEKSLDNNSNDNMTYPNQENLDKNQDIINKPNAKDEKSVEQSEEKTEIKKRKPRQKKAPIKVSNSLETTDQ